MRQIIRFTYFAVALIALLASCKRKPLYDEYINYETATIPIDVDWETSGVSPKNVTVLVYDATDNSLYMEHIYEQNDDEYQSYVELPVGEYKVVIFNEFRDNISNVGCANYDDFTTLSFYSTDITPTLARATGSDYVSQPGDLALTVVENVTITEDLVRYYYTLIEYDDGLSKTNLDTKTDETTKADMDQLIGLTAELKASKMSVSFHIENIDGALMPALVDLCNVASGYDVSNYCNTTTPVTTQFTMNSRTYDADSTTAGTIYADLALFGSLGNRYSTSGHTVDTPMLLDVLIMMNDGNSSIENRVIDITDLVTFSTDANGRILMTVNAFCDDPLPDIEEAEAESSGFGSTVTDWTYEDVGLKL